MKISLHGRNEDYLLFLKNLFMGSSNQANKHQNIQVSQMNLETS